VTAAEYVRSPESRVASSSSCASSTRFVRFMCRRYLAPRVRRKEGVRSVAVNIIAIINLLYSATMPSRPIQVSMDVDLLERIDADPETRERGRSAFLRSAAELYLSAKERRAIDDGIRRAYAGQADAMESEIAELLGEQEWPSP